jgi:hypothetical protein
VDGVAIRGPIVAATPRVAVEEPAGKASDLHLTPGISLATGVFGQRIRSAPIACTDGEDEDPAPSQLCTSRCPNNPPDEDDHPLPLFGKDARKVSSSVTR